MLALALHALRRHTVLPQSDTSHEVLQVRKRLQASRSGVTAGSGIWELQCTLTCNMGLVGFLSRVYARVTRVRACACAHVCAHMR